MDERTQLILHLQDIENKLQDTYSRTKNGHHFDELLLTNSPHHRHKLEYLSQKELIKQDIFLRQIEDL